MTGMRAQRGSKFGQIRLLTAELAALEHPKKTHKLIMGKMVLPLFLSYFDQILFIIAINDDIHKSFDDFKIRPDPIRDDRISCS